MDNYSNLYTLNRIIEDSGSRVSGGRTGGMIDAVSGIQRGVDVVSQNYGEYLLIGLIALVVLLFIKD